MFECDIFLEKQFFELFYMQVDMQRNRVSRGETFENDASQPKFLDINLMVSFYEIRWFDFYQFNYRTNFFILVILIMIFINILYIGFSKLYLKRIVRKLKKKKFENYCFDS